MERLPEFGRELLGTCRETDEREGRHYYSREGVFFRVLSVNRDRNEPTGFRVFLFIPYFHIIVNKKILIFKYKNNW